MIRPIVCQAQQAKCQKYSLNKIQAANRFQNRYKQQFKQNLLTLSNQNESMLVSSSLRASSNKQFQCLMNNKKVQKKLNCNSSKKQKVPAQRKPSGPIHNKRPEQTVIPKQSPCPCHSQITYLQQSISTCSKKIQQLQTVLKLVFSKTLTLQTINIQKSKEIQMIKLQFLQNQRLIKNLKEDNIRQHVKNKDDQQKIQKLSRDSCMKWFNHKITQTNQTFQLSIKSLEQKIQRWQNNQQQKTNHLIDIVKQFTNTQQIDRINNKSRSKSIYQHMKMNQSRANKPHQKSKISQYLSKSNLNSTIDGDLSIHSLSRIH